MNKVFTLLMTAIILATVVVVFGLGLLAIWGGPAPKPPPEAQARQALLSYGTDFDNWQYLSPSSDVQWRWDIADDGEQYVRLRRVASPQLLIYALSWQDQVVARAYWKIPCERGSTVTSGALNAEGIPKELSCVSDQDGTSWLRGETLLPSPSHWREDFRIFMVNEDLSQWDWALAASLPPPT